MTVVPGKNKIRIFSLASFGVIVLVAIIAANVLVWNSNRDKESKITGLLNDASLVQRNTQAMPPLPTDLDARLAAAQAALEGTQNALPGNISRNDILDYIINTAAQSRVKVAPLIANGLTADKTGQHHQVMMFTATVSGTLGNTTDFMTRLQGGDFPTLAITDCTVAKTEATDFSKPEYGTQVTVHLSIVVYVAAPAVNEDAAR
jgi:hypothetical protein